MKKRKILASLMATGFAFGVGITTASVVSNNYNNESSNITIQDGFKLNENKLSENQLRAINYGVEFNNIKLGLASTGLFNAVRNGNFIHTLGKDYTEIEGTPEDFGFDYQYTNGFNVLHYVKTINDTNGNVFAVIVQDVNGGEMYDCLFFEDGDQGSGFQAELVHECNMMYFGNCKIYISGIAGKNMKFNSSEHLSYVSNLTPDISFEASVFSLEEATHHIADGTMVATNGKKASQLTDSDINFVCNNNVIELDNSVTLPSGALDGWGELIGYNSKIGYESSDNDTPVIKGQATYFFNVDTAKDFNYVKSTITAYDETEGDITNKISFTNTDNYSLDNLHVGSYEFTASVSDEAGHSVSQKFSIVVSDVTAPTITATNKEQSYATCLTADEIKGLFGYSDNYYQNSDLTFTIVSDDYTNNYNKVGSHNITARVTDKSNNSSEATATINVVDNIAPVIACSSTYEISTISSKSLTLDKLVSTLGIIATDVIDGSINVTLTDLDNYSNKLGKAGSYTIRATASDSKGNTATADFVLNVVDEDYPVIKVDSPYCIYVQEGEQITESLIKQILIDSGQITTAEANTLHIESSALQMSYLSSGVYDLLLNFDGGRTEEVVLNVAEAKDEAKETTTIKDTFKTQMMSAIDNVTNIKEWNWINWVALGSSLITILFVVSFLKRKFRK